MTFRMALLALIGLVGGTACSTGPDEDAPPAVEVTISGVDQAAGLVSGTVRNIGGHTLTFGGCMTGFESGRDGDWKPVPREGPCDQYLGFLPPGHSVDFDLDLPGAGADCPLRVSAGLSTESAPDEQVGGHSSVFCPADVDRAPKGA